MVDIFVFIFHPTCIRILPHFNFGALSEFFLICGIYSVQTFVGNLFPNLKIFSNVSVD